VYIDDVKKWQRSKYIETLKNNISLMKKWNSQGK